MNNMKNQQHAKDMPLFALIMVLTSLVVAGVWFGSTMTQIIKFMDVIAG